MNVRELIEELETYTDGTEVCIWMHFDCRESELTPIDGFEETRDEYGNTIIYPY